MPPETGFSPAVRTYAGLIAGRIERGIPVFRGIPFAAPLGGPNRWRTPQPVEPWSGTRPCVTNGASCYQPPGRIAGLAALANRSGRAWLQAIGQHAAAEGDDCLNLIVWTPAAESSARLPVVVWIHGGGFISGAGSQPFYDGSALAAKGMVVVSINYRLSVWGFMGGDDLFDGDLGCSNRGFLDQLQALRWVHDNIEAFGGDPGCVTLMGESAGATSAIAMSMAPAANGLFHRIICMSGAAISVFPHSEYSALARDYFQMLGVQPGDSRALCALSLDQVRKASPPPAKFLEKHRARYGALGRAHFTVFGMATGTALFPLDLLKSLPQRPAFDLMIGTCRDESRAWTFGIPGPRSYVTREMYKYHSGILNPPDQHEIAFGRYKRALPELSDLGVYERAMTDALFRKWSVDYARAHSDIAPGRTWLYRYDWPSQVGKGELGAIHTIDIPGAFQTYDCMKPMLGDVAAARGAGDAFHDAIVNFIRTGKPHSARLPAWQPHDAHSKACMVFDSEPKLHNDIDGPVEAIW